MSFSLMQIKWVWSNTDEHAMFFFTFHIQPESIDLFPIGVPVWLFIQPMKLQLEGLFGEWKKSSWCCIEFLPLLVIWCFTSKPKPNGLNCQAVVHTPAWSRTRGMDVQGVDPELRCCNERKHHRLWRRARRLALVPLKKTTNWCETERDGTWKVILGLMVFFDSLVLCWITSGRC